ncbi:hypothetical protein D3C71_1500480 [compost metagenome]
MRHFFGIIFKAFQGINFTCKYNDSATDQAHFSITGNFTINYHTTCNGTHFTDFEDATYFSVTDNVLFIDRIKHTLHCTFDFLDYIVDDVMETNIYFFLFSSCLGLSVRTNVKANNNSIRCCCKCNIGFRNGTSTAVNDLHADAFHFDLSQGTFKCLD